MTTCDQDTALYMSQALLNHAREINHYVKAYHAPVMPDAEDETLRRIKFVRTVERMVNGMHALMLMAKHKGISRYCNQEQIEAYMDEAKALLESYVGGLRQSAPSMN